MIRPQFFFNVEDGGSGGDLPADSAFAAAARGIQGLDPLPTPEPKEAPTEPVKEPAKEPVKEAPKEEPKKAAEPELIPAALLKPQEKAKEVPAEELDREKLTKGMSDSARKNFARMEESYKAKLQKQAEELESYKAKASGGITAEEAKQLKAEADAIRAERDELAKTMEQIAAERSPQFQQKYVQGKKKLMDEAMKRIAKVEGDPSKFKQAMELQGRARHDALQEALSGLPTTVEHQVTALFTQIEMLEDESAEALQNAREQMSRWGEEETAKQREQSQKVMAAREARFKELIPKLSQDVLFLRRIEGEGADVWNKKVDEIEQEAQATLFHSTDFDQFASTALKAASHDRLQSAFEKMYSQLAEAQEQIRQLTASEPGSSNGAGGAGNASLPSESELSLAERWQKHMDTP